MTVGGNKQTNIVHSFKSKEDAQAAATKCKNVMSLVAGIELESRPDSKTAGMSGLQALKLRMADAHEQVEVQVHPSANGKEWEVEISETELGKMIPEEAKSTKKTIGDRVSDLFKRSGEK